MTCVCCHDLTPTEIRHLGVNVQMAIRHEKRRHRISYPPRWRTLIPRCTRTVPVVPQATAT